MSISRNKIFSLKGFAFLLLVTSLMGVNTISINIGFIQLSPYRILLMLTPFILVNIKLSTITRLKKSVNYDYFLFMLFWILYSVIPLLWINDFSGWFKIYIFLINGFVITWVIGLFLTSKNDIVNSLKIVELLGLIFGIVAFYEIFTGHYLFLNLESLEFYQIRSSLVSTIGIRMPVSVFGNPNDYAMFLLFSIFISFALYKVKSSQLGKVFSFILFVLFIFLLISTQSRSGFIGLLLGVFTYLVIMFKRSKSHNKLKFLFVVVFLITPFITYVLLEYENFYHSLITIDVASGGGDLVRVNLIKNGFNFLINSYFLGVGLGNIEFHMTNNALYPTYFVTNIHNWWMEILVSSGIFVFMFYIIVYIKNMIRLYKFSSYKHDKDMQVLSAVFLSFMVSFLITSMGASSLMYSEWIWPILAIVMSYINIYPKKKIIL